MSRLLYLFSRVLFEGFIQMSVEKISSEEYQKYMSSGVSTIEIWKSCYFAMLSNPEHKNTEMRDLVKLSRAHALALKTAMREHLGLKVDSLRVDS